MEGVIDRRRPPRLRGAVVVPNLTNVSAVRSDGPYATGDTIGNFPVFEARGALIGKYPLTDSML